MNVVISENNWVSKASSKYHYAFLFELKISIDLPNDSLSEEEYGKIKKGFQLINTTLAPYRRIAILQLKDAKKDEEPKGVVK